MSPGGPPTPPHLSRLRGSSTLPLPSGGPTVPDLITPLETVTFTVTKVPSRSAQLKTISRLMNMQPQSQRSLRSLAKRRRLHDNIVGTRAGRKWTNRVRTTKVNRVETGETFTLTLTSQIIPDVKSVEKFLAAAKAG